MHRKIEDGTQMTNRNSRAGAANLAAPLMILAFVTIGVFLYWLNANAVGFVVEVQEDDAPAPTMGGGFPQVTETELREGPERYVGQVVQVSGLPVAMAVGTQAFFLDVTDSPFLVMLSEGLIQQGATIPQGTVTVSGPMIAMTDSIMRDWIGRGIIPSRDQILVEFATHFIEARSVEITPDQQ
jgi:hypothetical protein